MAVRCSRQQLRRRGPTANGDSYTRRAGNVVPPLKGSGFKNMLADLGLTPRLISRRRLRRLCDLRKACNLRRELMAPQ
jgi:hypothetical protein